MLRLLIIGGSCNYKVTSLINTQLLSARNNQLLYHTSILGHLVYHTSILGHLVYHTSILGYLVYHTSILGHLDINKLLHTTLYHIF